MRLTNLSNHIMVDEFDQNNKPEAKVFISNLLHFLPPKIPESFSGTIYTNRYFAAQLCTYFNKRNIHPELINTVHYYILQPGVPCKIQLEGNKSCTVQIFESDDINKNILFAFQKENGKSLIYAGVCKEMRHFKHNAALKKLIIEGVEELYIELGNPSDAYDELEHKPIEFIRNLIKAHPEYRMLMTVPTFGYESFIYDLPQKCETLVRLNNIHEVNFKMLKKKEHFIEDERAKIIVTCKPYSMKYMQMASKEQNLIFVRVSACIAEINHLVDSGARYYKVHWSPLPTVSELRKLIRFVRPKRVLASEKTALNFISVPQPLPVELVQLCIDGKKQLAEELLLNTNLKQRTECEPPRMSNFFDHFAQANGYENELMPSYLQMVAFKRKRAAEWTKAHNNLADFPPDKLVVEEIDLEEYEPKMVIYRKNSKNVFKETLLDLDIPLDTESDDGKNLYSLVISKPTWEYL